MKYILEIVEFIITTIKEIILALIRKFNFIIFLIILVALGYMSGEYVLEFLESLNMKSVFGG